MSDTETDRAGQRLSAVAVQYRIAASRPQEHLFDVTMKFAANGESLLTLPAWIPGSYMVRDYARHVVTLTATDESGKALAVSREAKSRWHISAAAGEVTVKLTVYGWDLSVRGAHLDASHAYFNGACVFPALDGYDGPARVTIEAPAGISDQAVVATAMRAVDVDARGFGDYAVADYDELLDHPVEIAEQRCVTFNAAGIEHRFFVRGAKGFDEQRLAADCAKICAAHHELLGTPEDLDRYTFLAFALDKGYGGLEHRWSSSLVVTRSALPQPGGATDEKAYITLLGLISHEYFHLWNVRRLKPAAFTPLDLSGEVHTSLLWVFEGITSYYDDLAMRRAGVIDRATYLRLIGENLTRILRTPGRHLQSLHDSSFDAWTKFYKQDENAANSIISYYAKGALVALLLDLTLRAETATTLDDVMRECWQRFYLDGAGMPEDGLESVVNELSGQDFSGFFDRYVRGTEDPDLAPLLSTYGVQLELRAMSQFDDRGGVSATEQHRAYAGLRFDPAQPQRIAQVLSGSPAARAGLSAGDQLLAIDGLKADQSRIDQLLKRAAPGSEWRVHLFRRDELQETRLTLAAPPLDTAVLTIAEGVDDAISQRRAAWLGGDD